MAAMWISVGVEAVIIRGQSKSLLTKYIINF